MEMEGKILPNHPEAEQAVIGSLLLNQDIYFEINDKIKTASFYSPKHRYIFDTIVELIAQNDAVDIITVSKKLEDKELLEKIGGQSYLADLTDSVPTSQNAPHYAEIVREKEIRRKIIASAEEVSKLGYNDEGNCDEIIDAAESVFFREIESENTKGFTTLGVELTKVWEELGSLDKNSTSRGISSCFDSIDQLINGFQPSDLIILAARPSMGKTTLALDFARKAAVKNNVPVAFFSLEMSSKQLVERMLCSEAGVDAWKLRTGKLRDPQSMENVRDALDTLSRAPIFIDDHASNNIVSIRTAARRMKMKEDIQCIFVDYLQLVTPFHTARSDSTVQHVTEVSRTLKQIARELNVPVIALSQLSRDIEKREGKPRLADLRDSGSIEQDADLVMFIHRDKGSDVEGKKERTVELRVAKHRNGPIGNVMLGFDLNAVSFREVEKRYAQDEIVAPINTNDVPFDKLTKLFESFPGIGPRQAERFTRFVMQADNSYVEELSSVLTQANTVAKKCPECFRTHEEEENKCRICTDSARDQEVLFVVEKESEVASIESAGLFKGRYFVLGGLILVTGSPTNARIDELVKQIKKTGPKTVILGFSPDPDGEHTITTLKQKLLKVPSLEILGRGISSGSSIEYTDHLTLQHALENRKKI